MQSELHRNNVYQSVELLLLVSMLSVLAIPKCLPILKEDFYYTSLYTFCMSKGPFTGMLKRKASSLLGSNFL